MLVFTLFLFLTPEETFTDTKLFVPFWRQELAVADDGSVFLLIKDDNLVLKLDQHLNLVKRIGSWGQGPGGIQGANFISVVNEQLYVHCSTFVNEFSLDGRPLNQYKSWQRGTYYRLEKIKEGWLAMGSPESKTSELRWFSENFLEHKLITTWERSELQRVVGKPMVFNPAYSSERLIVADDQKSFYLKLPNGDNLLLYESINSKPKVLNLGVKRVPFNEEWGNKRLMLLKKNYPNNKVKVNFPKYYPVIRRLMKTAYGDLAIGITGAGGGFIPNSVTNLENQSSLIYRSKRG